MNTATEQAWRESAACREADPELFWPGAGKTDLRAELVIDQWCRRCPVRAECLADALAMPARFRDVGQIVGGKYFPTGGQG